MEHRTISDISKFARIHQDGPRPRWALRRERLGRLATLLDQHDGPVRLLSRVEYLPNRQRTLLRADHSPLAIAYADPVFRAEGLKGDRLGEVTQFLHLTQRQAHHLFCDCHYAGTVTSAMIAARARSMTRMWSFGEMWDRARHVLTSRP